MSLATLLSEPATQLRWTTAGTDAYGNAISEWTEVAHDPPLRGRWEQRSAEERTVDGNVVSSDWVLFLPPTVEVHARDRFSDRFGRTFEVVGAPSMRSAPNRDVYVEVSLRHVESV